MAPSPPTLPLSFDLEDYQQLVRRHVAIGDWDTPSPAFERQVAAIFDLLDELGAKATFFVLGMALKHHPDLIREIASRGDEIACHGTSHVKVFEQGPDEFRRDVTSCVELIEGLTGRRPIGYRAPAFSINRDATWAFEILAELGFAYDSSQYDSRKVPNRLSPVPDAPYELELPSGRSLHEFPITVWRRGGLALPMGGGSYWRVLPAPLLARGLGSVLERTDYPPLYFHPYEIDPEPLRAELPGSPSFRQRAVAAYHTARNTPGRKQVVARIRKIAREYEFITHEQALADIRADGRAGSRALSERGVLV